MTEQQTQAEHNKALVRRFFEEVLNQQHTAVLDQIIAPDFRTTFPATAAGREGFKQTVAAFFRAFPDTHSHVEDMIAEGDRVAARGHWTGTHQGEFMGIPPTGKQVMVQYSDIWVVENDKLTDNWVLMDILGMLQQLGVAPTPGQAS
jgi:steroid delta-isomerase-like uncharacterized protein